MFAAIKHIETRRLLDAEAARRETVDAEHLGTHISQQHSAHRARADADKLDHPYSGERTAAVAVTLLSHRVSPLSLRARLSQIPGTATANTRQPRSWLSHPRNSAAFDHYDKIGGTPLDEDLRDNWDSMEPGVGRRSGTICEAARPIAPQEDSAIPAVFWRTNEYRELSDELPPQPFQRPSDLGAL
jgi:hypothetical protein